IEKTKIDDPEQNGMTVESFMQKVNRHDKVVFVYFNADWCVPCIKLKPVIDAVETNTKLYCDVMKLDVDENPLIATHFEINTLPIFMIYKNGKSVWTHTGALTEVELR